MQESTTDAYRALHRWRHATEDVRGVKDRRPLVNATDPYDLHPDNLIAEACALFMADAGELSDAVRSASLDPLSLAVRVRGWKWHTALCLAFDHWPWSNGYLPPFGAKQMARQAVAAA